MAESYAVALLAMLLAGGVAGLTGFGFALVSSPLLLLVFDPPTVVAVMLVLSLLINSAIALDSWRQVRVRPVLSLLPWALAGLLLGAEVLQVLGAGQIRLLAGVTVVVFALLMIWGVEIPGLGSRWGTAAAGGASGALSTSTGLAGPPVVMLFAARGFPKESFRASNAAYFLCISLAGLALFFLRDLLSASHLYLAAALLPAVLLGKAAGTRLLLRVSDELFRRITLALVLVAGLAAVASGLYALVP